MSSPSGESLPGKKSTSPNAESKGPPRTVRNASRRVTNEEQQKSPVNIASRCVPAAKVAAKSSSSSAPARAPESWLFEGAKGIVDRALLAAGLIDLPQEITIRAVGGRSAAMTRVFSILDVDGSGFVSNDELLAVAVLENETGTGSAHLQRLLRYVDIDGDGRISKSEWEKRLIDWFAKTGEDDLADFDKFCHVLLSTNVQDRVHRVTSSAASRSRPQEAWDNIRSDNESDDVQDYESKDSLLKVPVGQRIGLLYKNNWLLCEVKQVLPEKAFPYQLGCSSEKEVDGIWCLLDWIRSRVSAPLLGKSESPFVFCDLESIASPDEVANALLSKGEIRITAKQLINLITRTRKIIVAEPSLLEIRTDGKGSGVTILGDIHGNFPSLRDLTRLTGAPSTTEALLFLGDVVDRGANSINCMALIMAWKLTYPDKVFLVRGNHEDMNVNCRYGFLAECYQRFGGDGEVVYRQFSNLFTYLPLAALVGTKDRLQIFACHGGIGPSMSQAESILKVERPTGVDVYAMQPSQRIVRDLLWADPIADNGNAPKTNNGFCRNVNRGLSHMFDETATANFLGAMHLKMIVRGHEVAEKGMLLQHGGKVMTLFSSYNYQNGNSAAAVKYVDHVDRMKCWQIHADGKSNSFDISIKRKLASGGK